jgi:hypothetical protein
MWGLIRIMIIGSLLLLVAGAVILVIGLATGNDSFLVGTIVASLMAAVCLYAGSRNRSSRETEPPPPRRARRDSVADDDVDPMDDRLRNRAGGQDVERDGDSRSESRRDRESRFDDRSPTAEADNRRSSREDEYLDFDVETEAVPSDEPSEVPMSSVEAAALMRMDAEVMVVDGRPRFHLGGCVHLVGRESESLPAYEAVELGFTACSLCRPAQSLLREPTRG